jgi:hypothetical protein
MFGDFEWDGGRTAEQSARLETWLPEVASPRLVIVECGAGTAVPTVRHASEEIAAAAGGLLIRINPREPTAGSRRRFRHVDLPVGALEGIRAIDGRLPRA